MPKSNIRFIPIQNTPVHVCCVLFLVCLYICVCECLLQNNNHQKKNENNTNCGSAFEPGTSGLPYHCASIYVRFDVIGVLAVWIQNKKQKKQKPGPIRRGACGLLINAPPSMSQFV